MKCTNCGLINPENSMRCDCGYDFVTHVVKVSPIIVQQTPLQKCGFFLLRTLLIFLNIGPLVGYFSSFLIRPILLDISFTANDLRFLFGMIPISYLIGGLPAVSTGIIYGIVSLMLPHKIMRTFLLRAVLGGVIGTVTTKIYFQFIGFDADLILWTGLPAGAICSLLPQNRPPHMNTSRNNGYRFQEK